MNFSLLAMRRRVNLTVNKQQKGQLYVIHNSGGLDRPLASGLGDEFHDGWIHSHPAGGRGDHDTGQSLFWPETGLLAGGESNQL